MQDDATDYQGVEGMLKGAERQVARCNGLPPDIARPSCGPAS